jgi:hypothetical protein
MTIYWINECKLEKYLAIKQWWNLCDNLQWIFSAIHGLHARQSKFLNLQHRGRTVSDWKGRRKENWCWWGQAAISHSDSAACCCQGWGVVKLSSSSAAELNAIASPSPHVVPIPTVKRIRFTGVCSALELRGGYIYYKTLLDRAGSSVYCACSGSLKASK